MDRKGFHFYFNFDFNFNFNFDINLIDLEWKQLKLLELKLPWLRYEKELERAQHFADLIEQAQAAYDRFQQEMGPLTEEIKFDFISFHFLFDLIVFI